MAEQNRKGMQFFAHQHNYLRQKRLERLWLKCGRPRKNRRMSGIAKLVRYECDVDLEFVDTKIPPPRGSR